MKQSELNSELMRLLHSLDPKSHKALVVPLVLSVDVPFPWPAAMRCPEPYIVLIAPNPTK